MDGVAPGELQIYSAKLRFVAHLTGLRWLMYYHRIISFFLFCGVFFTIVITTALILWAASSFLYANDGKMAEESVVPETESIKSVADAEDQEPAKEVLLVRKKSSSSMRANREDPTRRELEDQARRLAQARNRNATLVHSNTDTEDDEHETTLRHLQFGTGSTASEDEAVVVKKEDDVTSGDSSPNWQDVSFTDKTDQPPGSVKKEEAEEASLAGESHISADRESSTSARLAREQSLRRRASNRSLQSKEAP